MADKEPRQPTHRAYSVIRREGQDDYWLNIGLVFPHKDDGGHCHSNAGLVRTDRIAFAYG